jgi:glutathione synthase/RimK-type ligase-like ATP-grasp enzyme
VSKPRVTLATCLDHPELDPGEEGLPDALAERGIDPRVAAWDDESVDWAEAGIVVLRAVHNYAARRPDFLAWAAGIRKLLNSADTVEWNTDKHYLQELGARGMPTIDTVWLEPEKNLSKHQVHTRFPSLGDFVVKPAVSSGSRDTGRYTARDAMSRMDAIQHAYGLLQEGRSVMVQRYVQSVDERGETALIYLNGVLSHTVEKEAMLLGSLASAEEVAEEVATAREATEAELRTGEQARAAIHGYIKSRMGRDAQLLFSRIDMVEGDSGEPRVMEVSLVDASLYLGAVDGAVDGFADAIASRAFW